MIRSSGVRLGGQLSRLRHRCFIHPSGNALAGPERRKETVHGGGSHFRAISPGSSTSQCRTASSLATMRAAIKPAG